MRLRLAIVLITVAVGVVLLTLLAKSFIRPDPRIDALVCDFKRISPQEAAIEREVVEAELAYYGSELIPGLRAELNRGAWRRSKLGQWIMNNAPGAIRSALSEREDRQDRRRAGAALTLGRLGPIASVAIPDLEALAGSGSGWDDGPLMAEVALAMIQRGSPSANSNAVAALTSGAQIQRLKFATHASEIWPDQPDILLIPLKDPDASVRSLALLSMRSYGLSASNTVPVLLQMLDDPSPHIHPGAAMMLGLLSPEHMEIAVTIMLQQQRTNASWTGDQAYVLYQAAGPSAKEAVPSLQAELADPDGVPRRCCGFLVADHGKGHTRNSRRSEQRNQSWSPAFTNSMPSHA